MSQRKPYYVAIRLLPVDMSSEPSNLEQTTDREAMARGVSMSSAGMITATALTAFLAACGGGSKTPTQPDPPQPPPTSQTVPIEINASGIHNPGQAYSSDVYLLQRMADGALGRVKKIGTLAEGKITGNVEPGKHIIEVAANDDIYSRVLGVDIDPRGKNIFSGIDLLDKKPSGISEDYLNRLNRTSRRNLGWSLGERAKYTDGIVRVIGTPTFYVDLESARTANMSLQLLMNHLGTFDEEATRSVPQVYGINGVRNLRICNPYSPPGINCDGNTLPEFTDPYNPKFIISFVEGLKDVTGREIGATYNLAIMNNVSYRGMTIPNVIAGGKILVNPRIQLSILGQDYLEVLGVTQDYPDQPGDQPSIFNDNKIGPVSRIDEILGHSVMGLLPGSRSENNTEDYQTLQPASVIPITGLQPQSFGFEQPGYAPPEVLQPERQKTVRPGKKVDPFYERHQDIDRRPQRRF